MASYVVDVAWTLQEGEDFGKGRYSRGHHLHFDGGATIEGSASPHVVGKWAVEAAVDPEEMLVAALSTCHMLSFLHVARTAGFAVRAYRDHAAGQMDEIAPGRQAITDVALHPEITWLGDAPSAAEIAHMHHQAHEICFIANSVKTEVRITAAAAPRAEADASPRPGG